MTELRIDYASHEASLHAVEHWHYSRRLPTPPIVRFGVWEGERFVGVVLFSRGASLMLGKKYGLRQEECCELTRIALRDHVTPVSRIVAIALKLLRKHSPKLRLVVSFADPVEGHHGGIYQGGGWIYTGTSAATKLHFHQGRWKHVRTIGGSSFGKHSKPENLDRLPSKIVPGKHRYLMPLDHALRRQIESLRKGAPRRGG